MYFRNSIKIENIIDSNKFLYVIKLLKEFLKKQVFKYLKFKTSIVFL